MTTITLKKYYWLGSGLLIIPCCFFLFWLDHETKSVWDLMTSGNMVALVIYFIPTFLLCSFLYFLFNKKMNWDNSFVLSHFIGIPVAFALVIFVLMWNMGRL